MFRAPGSHRSVRLATSKPMFTVRSSTNMFTLRQTHSCPCHAALTDILTFRPKHRCRRPDLSANTSVHRLPDLSAQTSMRTATSIHSHARLSTLTSMFATCSSHDRFRLAAVTPAINAGAAPAIVSALRRSRPRSSLLQLPRSCPPFDVHARDRRCCSSRDRARLLGSRIRVQRCSANLWGPGLDPAPRFWLGSGGAGTTP